MLKKLKTISSMPYSGIMIMLTFLVFLLLQHSMVYLYHDDWGFAVLDYGVAQKGFLGQDFTIKNVLDFLYDIYFRWSGRLGGFFTHIYMQKLGLEFIQIFQSFIILFITILSLLIASKITQKTITTFSTSVSVLLYLSLPFTILVGGVYWYSASSTNLWGIPSFLLSIYITHTKKEITWLSLLFLLCSVTFHEQLAIAILTYMFIYILFSISKDRLKHILKFILLLGVASLVIFAPGNLNRKNAYIEFYNSNSLIEILTTNLNTISHNFFFPSSANIFSIMLFISLVSLIFILIFKNSTKKRYRLFLLVPLILFALYLKEYKISYLLTIVISYTAVLFLVTYQTRDAKIIFVIYLASLASLLPLLYSPSVAGRTGIIYFFLSYIPILYTIMKVQDYLPNLVKLIFILAMTYITSSSVLTIYNGYKDNHSINKTNHQKLMGLNKKQTSVKLLKLKNPPFAEVMPYQRPLIEKWMKKYYTLPQKTRFVWEDEI